MTRRRPSRRRRAGKVVLNKTVLGLVGGAPGGGETPIVADSSAAGAGRFFHNSVPPSKQHPSLPLLPAGQLAVLSH